MRWLKHMTATRQDERIADYLNECGPALAHEGYGFYWALLEVVASHVENGTNKCSATYPLAMWSKMLFCHHHKAAKYFGKLAKAGLIKLRGTSDLPGGYPEATSTLPQDYLGITRGSNSEVMPGYTGG